MIEKMIGLLDQFDGDADMEPSLGGPDSQDREGDEHDGREPDVDDEGSLGWTNSPNQSRIAVQCAQTALYWTDCEGPDPDREPSLGAPEPSFSPEASQAFIGRGLNQENWAAGGTRDLEDDGDDREPDCMDDSCGRPVAE